MSTLAIDEMFIRQISFRLPKFKAKGNHTYSCRCVICGDSQKNQNKSRFYAYAAHNRLFVKCHNCGYSSSFEKFLERFDYFVYQQYVIEKLRQNTPIEQRVETVAEEEPSVIVKPSSSFKKISQLAPTHPAKMYIMQRMIPSHHHYRIFYTPRFKEFVNSLVPGKLSDNVPEHDRIVFPFIDKAGNIIGLSGRAIDPKAEKKYMVLMLANKPHIYGLDIVDVSKDIYVVEGQIDSLFIENAIAVGGSDLVNNLSTVSEDKEKFIIVYDNEPRSPIIVQKIERVVNAGYRVVIWPDHIEEKDINEMVLAGHDVNRIIKENTFQGLSAQLNFKRWKKV